MSDSVVLIGGGGHARVIMDCIQASGGHVLGILDDAIPVGTLIHGIPVLGCIADAEQLSQYVFVIGIGNNEVRARIAKHADVRWHTAVHPTAVVSPSAVIGKGTVVMPNAVINADAVIGAHCIINTAAVVEHDCVLEDCVHISPAVALGGTVRVGRQTNIGIGACVRNNISICEDCTIGAGAVVVKNIMEPGTYLGTPARRKE